MAPKQFVIKKTDDAQYLANMPFDGEKLAWTDKAHAMHDRFATVNSLCEIMKQRRYAVHLVEA
jgi:hypothetical protein